MNFDLYLNNKQTDWENDDNEDVAQKAWEGMNSEEYEEYLTQALEEFSKNNAETYRSKLTEMTKAQIKIINGGK